jgi:DNA topoisomerase-1
VTLDRALELLSQPKALRGGRKNATPLRDLGPHPEDAASVGVFDGRYGPYVKHGTISASIPSGSDPQAITLEAAVDLLEAKRAAKGGSRKKAVKKQVAKKTKKKAAAKTKKAKKKE